MGGKSIHKGAERLFLCAIPNLSLSNSVYHPPCGKVPVSGIFSVPSISFRTGLLLWRVSFFTQQMNLLNESTQVGFWCIDIEKNPKPKESVWHHFFIHICVCMEDIFEALFVYTPCKWIDYIWSAYIISDALKYYLVASLQRKGVTDVVVQSVQYRIWEGHWCRKAQHGI
jgi:hypothetical protein